MRTFLFLFAYAIFFSSCNNPAPTTETEEPKEEVKTGPTGTEVVQASGVAFDKGDEAWMNANLTDDFVFSGPSPEPMNKEGYIGMMKRMKTAFPDLNTNLKVTGEDGNKVMGTVQVQGTHNGEWDLTAAEMGKFKPTGKAFKLPVENFTITVNDGKIARFEVQVPEGGGLKGIVSQLGLAKK